MAISRGGSNDIQNKMELIKRYIGGNREVKYEGIGLISLNAVIKASENKRITIPKEFVTVQEGKYGIERDIIFDVFSINCDGSKLKICLFGNTQKQIHDEIGRIKSIIMNGKWEKNKEYKIFPWKAPKKNRAYGDLYDDLDEIEIAEIERYMSKAAENPNLTYTLSNNNGILYGSQKYYSETNSQYNIDVYTPPKKTKHIVTVNIEDNSVNTKTLPQALPTCNRIISISKYKIKEVERRTRCFTEPKVK